MPIDYKKYPENWKKEIVPAVIKRADGKCEMCGLENYATVWSVRFPIRDTDGRYKLRSIWFSNEKDANRECRNRPVRKIKVVLTVAHLDHDETNHYVSLDRLKALCQACHLRYDSKEKYRRMEEKWAKKSPG
jgi:hypothetical protein